jgi:hypothetical protein
MSCWNSSHLTKEFIGSSKQWGRSRWAAGKCLFCCGSSLIAELDWDELQTPRYDDTALLIADKNCLSIHIFLSNLLVSVLCVSSNPSHLSSSLISGSSSTRQNCRRISDDLQYSNNSSVWQTNALDGSFVRQTRMSLNSGRMMLARITFVLDWWDFKVFGAMPNFIPYSQIDFDHWWKTKINYSSTLSALNWFLSSFELFRSNSDTTDHGSSATERFDRWQLRSRCMIVRIRLHSNNIVLQTVTN